MASPSNLQRECFEAWNRRDFEKMRQLLHANYIYTGPEGGEQTGPDAALKIARMWATAFPDGKIEIKKIVAQSSISICEYIGRGTHNGELMGVKPTGKSVELRVCNIIEARDGKIFRAREYMDLLSLMTQLGAVTLPESKAA